MLGNGEGAIVKGYGDVLGDSEASRMLDVHTSASWVKMEVEEGSNDILLGRERVVVVEEVGGKEGHNIDKGGHTSMSLASIGNGSL